MEKRWFDKNAATIISIITLILLGLLIGIWVERLPKGDLIGPLIFTLIGLLGFATQAHYLPLKVSNGLIYLASSKFPSIGRKAVRLDEIKEIFIDHRYRSFDEGGNWGLSKGVLLIVRVTDNRGKKYRNIIFRDSLPEFKKVIKEQGFNGLLKGH